MTSLRSAVVALGASIGCGMGFRPALYLFARNRGLYWLRILDFLHTFSVLLLRLFKQAFHLYHQLLVAQ